MPSSTLAATIQPQAGRQVISSGTGSADSQPATSSRLAADRSASAPAARLVSALAAPKATMKARIGRVPGEAEVVRADQRQHGALQADHAADERVEATSSVNCGRWPAGRAEARSQAPARRGGSSGHGTPAAAGGGGPVAGPPTAPRGPGVRPGQQAGGGHGPFAVAAHHRPAGGPRRGRPGRAVCAGQPPSSTWTRRGRARRSTRRPAGRPAPGRSSAWR